MKKGMLVSLVLFLIFTGCEKTKEISIAANEWIGYAPIFYANEKGWLKKDKIRVIRTVSLAESVKLYESGLVNGLAATQYEYFQIKKEVKPIILLDKSYGGDMILSNRSIEELKKAKKIDVYLEMGSVNYLLLQYFAKKYNIPLTKMNFHSNDQEQLSQQSFDMKKNILIVTYSPYDKLFIKKGFKVIDSTRNDKDLLVIDAIFIHKHCENRQRFKNFKKQIDMAVEVIKKNPKSAYEVIKNYFPDYSYEDFKKALGKIKWINNPDKDLLLRLKKIGFDTKDLIDEN
ncbi:hypothetical protein [Caminibacter pacificus]|uniref:NitT/TauT family transport system substrate-binding protein n=1 Tax=Caminibacter pacificus TaxID=1424653 RepID=A0AAJ4RBY8_9BACT|nr:hypothetical protein [Caminibacter pacificus]NPA87602.1 hypothetical protein [Campylobacterota bacterium]QCI28799.1 hypothetical protein C6V80_07410 [Caminibacter pacificus]ROR39387.1 NitT/TauT family transport system substrate-binding protein [Caminibacter pacificus]